MRYNRPNTQFKIKNVHTYANYTFFGRVPHLSAGRWYNALPARFNGVRWQKGTKGKVWQEKGGEGNKWCKWKEKRLELSVCHCNIQFGHLVSALILVLRVYLWMNDCIGHCTDVLLIFEVIIAHTLRPDVHVAVCHCWYHLAKTCAFRWSSDCYRWLKT